MFLKLGLRLTDTNAPRTGVPAAPAGYALLTRVIDGTTYYLTRVIDGVTYYLMRAI